VSPPRPPRRNPEGRGHSVLGVSSWPCTTPNTRHGHSHAVTHSARPVAGASGFEWCLSLCCAGTPWALRGFESDSSCRMPHQCDGGRESFSRWDTSMGVMRGQRRHPLRGCPTVTPRRASTRCVAGARSLIHQEVRTERRGERSEGAGGEGHCSQVRQVHRWRV
jgi:hypothetical protein